MHLLQTVLFGALLCSSSLSSLHLDKRYQKAPLTPTKSAKNAKVTSTLACPIPGLPNYSGTISLSTASAPTSWSKPSQSSTFQVVLQNNTEVRAEPGVDVYDIDSRAVAFASLQAANKYIVCYFSAGTMETWRADFGCFNQKLGA
jgi:endo-alpha-1,4-polygalactosaminidase (GH114 family)